MVPRSSAYHGEPLEGGRVRASLSDGS